MFWDDEAQTILRFDISGVWTWEEFWKHFDDHALLAAERRRRVDIISTIRTERGLPPGAFAEFRKIESRAPANVVLQVVVVDSAFARATISTFTRVFRKRRFISAATLDDARRLIAEDRVRGDAAPTG